MNKAEGWIAVIGCNNCGKCDNICPHGALQRRDGKVSIDYSRCTVCMKCINVCPVRALVYVD